MKQIYQFIFGLLIMLTCSGCFEIVEQISLNENGSGSFKLIVNASQSKDNLKGIMAQDSIFGKPLPKQSEITTKMEEAKKKFAGQTGISGVTLIKDFNNYIFTLSCEFNNVSSLDKALVNTVQSYEKNGRTIPSGNYSLSGNTFKRQVGYDYTEEVTKNMNAQVKSILEKAKFTAIYRFPKPVKSLTNSKAKKSPTGKAVMLSANMLEIAKSKQIIANTIVME